MLMEMTRKDKCLTDYQNIAGDVENNVNILRAIGRSQFPNDPRITSLLQLTPSPTIRQHYKATWLSWAKTQFAIVGEALAKETGLHGRTVQSLIPKGAVDLSNLGRNANNAILMPVGTYVEHVIKPLEQTVARLAVRFRGLGL